MMSRRLSLQTLLRAFAAVTVCSHLPSARPAACTDWPLWHQFLDAFFQADGRIIDRDNGTRYTTSEGQAYALFFSLVMGDRARFDVLLNWIQHNLAGHDLGARLPGWRWGLRDDSQWALIDANAATDADLWLAYTLLEAGRIWGVERFRTLGTAIARMIAVQETTVLPGFGEVLLSGPHGSLREDGSVRINPSYFVLPQLRGMALHDPSGPWSRIAANLPKLLTAVSPRGVAPDWAVYTPGSGWRTQPTPSIGSYDAIRVYLWIGLTAPEDPLKRQLLKATNGMLKHLTGTAAPPREIRVDAGASKGTGPAGFSAALLPWLHALGHKELLAQQSGRWSQRGESGGAQSPDQPANYYDLALGLFGTGILEGRFYFDADGRLRAPCAEAAASRKN